MANENVVFIGLIFIVILNELTLKCAIGFARFVKILKNQLMEMVDRDHFV
jgi:hypothetical protein